MKNKIQNFLIAGFLAISSIAFGQSSTTPQFISKIVPPIPVVMTETSDSQFSFVNGLSENAPAFGLVIKNKTDHAITLTWILKDKSGNTFGAKHVTTLEANSTLDYSSKSVLSQSLIYLIPENFIASDFEVEILN